MHLVGAGSSCQCFPLSHVSDSALEKFRVQYAEDAIIKEDVFHYIYALLHHPEYRERYAANLKRELPRIPASPMSRTRFAAGLYNLERRTYT